MVSVLNAPMAADGARERGCIELDLAGVLGYFLVSLPQAGAGVLRPGQARDAGHAGNQRLPFRTEAPSNLEHLGEAVLLATVTASVHGRVLIDRPLLVTKGSQRIMKRGLVALDADQQGVAGCSGSREPPF